MKHNNRRKRFLEHNVRHLGKNALVGLGIALAIFGRLHSGVIAREDGLESDGES